MREATKSTKKRRTLPRKAPTQERSQATVSAILDATARVLIKVGYDHASTNRIAEAAGVSIGSLYQYFPSKEAIVAALGERHSAALTALLHDKLVEAQGSDLAVAVREIVEAMVAAHLIEPRLHKVLIEQVPRVGRLEQILDIERQMTAFVRLNLEARARELRVTDLDAAAFVIVNAVEGVTHAATLHETTLSVARLAGALTDMVVRYLRN